MTSLVSQAPRVGSGINWWNNVHVKDLARGYVFLLKQLERAGETGWNGYWFAESEEHQCKSGTKYHLSMI